MRYQLAPDLRLGRTTYVVPKLKRQVEMRCNVCLDC